MKNISHTLQKIGVFPPGKNLTPGIWNIQCENFNVLFTWQDRNRKFNDGVYVQLWDTRKDARLKSTGSGAHARERCVNDLINGKPTIAVQVVDANLHKTTYNTMEHERKIAPSANRVVFLLENDVLRPEGEEDKHLIYSKIVRRFKDDDEVREYLSILGGVAGYSTS
jgi:hypothetical protein